MKVLAHMVLIYIFQANLPRDYPEVIARWRAAWEALRGHTNSDLSIEVERNPGFLVSVPFPGWEILFSDQ